MSGQDVNPFADPNDVNPFADPSVIQHTNQSKKQNDDYNPFADKPATTQEPPPTIPATIEPAKAEPVSTFQAPPFGGYNTSTAQRQDELERKAAELEKKELELNKLQQAADQANNFPPLPSFCPIGPCFYHDISVDIPNENQKTCRMFFYTWQLYIFTLFFNFISSIALMSTKGDKGAVTFGVSVLYLVLFTPCSFLLWYRPIYKALKTDSSFSYMLFFFVFFFQILFTVLYALGIPGFGTCGFINGTKEAEGGNKAVSAMMFICGGLWALLSLFMVFLLRKVHIAYRQSGASLEKAQGELARGVASNKNVQKAAAEAVVAGAQSSTRY